MFLTLEKIHLFGSPFEPRQLSLSYSTYIIPYLGMGMVQRDINEKLGERNIRGGHKVSLNPKGKIKCKRKKKNRSKPKTKLVKNKKKGEMTRKRHLM